MLVSTTHFISGQGYHDYVCVGIISPYCCEYWILGSHGRNTLKYPSLEGEISLVLIHLVCTAYYSIMLVVCFVDYFLVCISIFGGL